MNHRVPILLMLVILSCLRVDACLWDTDTLLMELRRFPTVLELITGKFLRHSPEYYQWRVQDRLKLLEAEPKRLRWRDDLAVAYDKTGQTDKAISVAIATLELRPDRYESLANLGTFYIHASEFEKGLDYIEKAIEINENAHFGREIYQRLLVQYLLEVQDEGQIVLPLYDYDRNPSYRGFGKYVLEAREKLSAQPADREHELALAQKGVLGMMRFGKHDSPILLEALGDLLSYARNPEYDAKQLAARAYLKASYEVADPVVKEKYRRKARFALSDQTRTGTKDQLPVDELEAEFAQELKAADIWYKQLVDDEKSWIAESIDVDKAYKEKYYKDPTIETGSPEPERRESSLSILPVQLAGLAMFACVLVWIFSRSKTRSVGRA